MHEMGIAHQIIQIAVDAIPADTENCKINAVNVEIGTLSAIVPDSLSFCFEIGAKGTPCAEAELIITIVPAVMKCNDCNTEWNVDEIAFQCQSCQSINIQMIKNCDIDIISINIDD